MQHPPCSPDMVPSDYYLFSHLYLHLDGPIFHSNDKVISEVDRFLDSHTPQFFVERIEKLPKRWQIIEDLIEDSLILISYADFVSIYPFTSLRFLVENFLYEQRNIIEL
ncbi:histone-lysine N-methyltransferase SETMAR [Trichonephila clavipes]|nr:histone-lysine N-methyltransferase SETMAR [Trichonephila clavipes]